MILNTFPLVFPHNKTKINLNTHSERQRLISSQIQALVNWRALHLLQPASVSTCSGFQASFCLICFSFYCDYCIFHVSAALRLLLNDLSLLFLSVMFCKVVLQNTDAALLFYAICLYFFILRSTQQKRFKSNVNSCKLC